MSLDLIDQFTKLEEYIKIEIVLLTLISVLCAYLQHWIFLGLIFSYWFYSLRFVLLFLVKGIFSKLSQVVFKTSKYFRKISSNALSIFCDKCVSFKGLMRWWISDMISRILGICWFHFSLKKMVVLVLGCLVTGGSTISIRGYDPLLFNGTLQVISRSPSLPKDIPNDSFVYGPYVKLRKPVAENAMSSDVVVRAGVGCVALVNHATSLLVLRANKYWPVVQVQNSHFANCTRDNLFFLRKFCVDEGRFVQCDYDCSVENASLTMRRVYRQYCQKFYPSLITVKRVYKPVGYTNLSVTLSPIGSSICGSSYGTADWVVTDGGCSASVETESGYDICARTVPFNVITRAFEGIRNCSISDFVYDKFISRKRIDLQVRKRGKITTYKGIFSKTFSHNEVETFRTGIDGYYGKWRLPDRRVFHIWTLTVTFVVTIILVIILVIVVCVCCCHKTLWNRFINRLTCCNVKLRVFSRSVDLFRARMRTGNKGFRLQSVFIDRRFDLDDARDVRLPLNDDDDEKPTGCFSKLNCCGSGKGKGCGTSSCNSCGSKKKKKYSSPRSSIGGPSAPPPYAAAMMMCFVICCASGVPFDSRTVSMDISSANCKVIQFAHRSMFVCVQNATTVFSLETLAVGVDCDLSTSIDDACANNEKCSDSGGAFSTPIVHDSDRGIDSFSLLKRGGKAVNTTKKCVMAPYVAGRSSLYDRAPQTGSRSDYSSCFVAYRATGCFVGGSNTFRKYWYAMKTGYSGVRGAGIDNIVKYRATVLERRVTLVINGKYVITKPEQEVVIAGTKISYSSIHTNDVNIVYGYDGKLYLSEEDFGVHKKGSPFSCTVPIDKTNMRGIRTCVDTSTRNVFDGFDSLNLRDLKSPEISRRFYTGTRGSSEWAILASSYTYAGTKEFPVHYDEIEVQRQLFLHNAYAAEKISYFFSGNRYFSAFSHTLPMNCVMQKLKSNQSASQDSVDGYFCSEGSINILFQAKNIVLSLPKNHIDKKYLSSGAFKSKPCVDSDAFVKLSVDVVNRGENGYFRPVCAPSCRPDQIFLQAGVNHVNLNCHFAHLINATQSVGIEKCQNITFRCKEAAFGMSPYWYHPVEVHRNGWFEGFPDWVSTLFPYSWWGWLLHHWRMVFIIAGLVIALIIFGPMLIGCCQNCVRAISPRN